MATLFDLPAGAGHPALTTNSPLTSTSSHPQQSELGQYLGAISKRSFEILGKMSIPRTDDTLVTSINEELTAFVNTIRTVHQDLYDGWISDVFPMERTENDIILFRRWNDIPMIMEQNPEGVTPQVVQFRYEDFVFNLLRFGIGAKAKHASFFKPENLAQWIEKQTLFPYAFFRTAQLLILSTIDMHPSAFVHQIKVTGARRYNSIAEAMTWETEHFLAGIFPKRLYYLVNSINYSLSQVARDQLPYNVLVLPHGAAQMIAAQNFETNVAERGPKARSHLEGGGKAWIAGGIPGFSIYEAFRLNAVNFDAGYRPLERRSVFSTWAMLSGREAIHDDDTDWHGMLSVK